MHIQKHTVCAVKFPFTLILRGIRQNLSVIKNRIRGVLKNGMIINNLHGFAHAPVKGGSRDTVNYRSIYIVNRSLTEVR